MLSSFFRPVVEHILLECANYTVQSSRLKLKFFTKVNPLQSRGNYSATSNNMKLVYWPLMGELLHLVQ